MASGKRQAEPIRHRDRSERNVGRDSSAERHNGNGDRMLTSADAASVIGMTPDAVRAAAKTGRLPVAAETVGGVRLFRLADVEAFKRQREERRELAAR